MCWYLGEFGSVSIDLTRQAFERVLGAPPPLQPHGSRGPGAAAATALGQRPPPPALGGQSSRKVPPRPLPFPDLGNGKNPFLKGSP